MRVSGLHHEFKVELVALDESSVHIDSGLREGKVPDQGRVLLGVLGEGQEVVEIGYF